MGKGKVNIKVLEKVLDEHVRPALAEHGGAMRVERVADGVVYFRLLGQCAGCASADLTSEYLVNKELKARVPGVKRAELVTDVSPELYEQAMEILRRNRGT